MCEMSYIHTIEYYSTLKGEILTQATTWMKLTLFIIQYQEDPEESNPQRQEVGRGQAWGTGRGLVSRVRVSVG